MIGLATSANDSAWRRATVALVLGVLIWQSLWLLAAYLLTGGKEFADDAPTYRFYVDDPGMLFTERHEEVFGAAVAPPFLPVELKLFHSFFASAGDFLAFRVTMLLHMMVAYAVGFAVAFRHFGAPTTAKAWLQAVLVAIVPVGWVTVLTVQDDSVAAAWSGLCLAAYVAMGPMAAAIAAGFGMFFGKILLALAFLALWIATPGRRVGIAMVGSAFLLALVTLLWWRDGGLGQYAAYVYPPYMGASAYGLMWLTMGEFDLYAARNLSALLTLIGLGAFTWLAVQRRLSFVSAATGLHALFLFTYFGAMPDYYVWFFPFLIVTLWCCCRRRLWGTFAVGWLMTFFAYAYKVLYGANSRFGGRKVGLQTWVAENIPFEIQSIQIAVAFAAVACTFCFALAVLFRDPGRGCNDAGPSAISS